MCRSLFFPILLVLVAAFAGTAAVEPAAEPATGSVTWEAAMAQALAMAEDKQIDALIDRQLAPAFIARLKEQHGAEKWRSAISKELERLPYYYGWLRKADKRTVETTDKRIIVRGEYGCFAEFEKVEGVFRIGPFGQEITSM